MERLTEGDLAILCPEVTAAERACWCGQLAQYGDLLQRWARRMNLVAEGDLSYLAVRHLAPALRLRPLLKSLPHERILDIGSGGGLPAIPLKITLPGSALTLVEGRRRRCSFLRQVVRGLGLDRAEVRNQRLEGGSPIAAGHTVAILRGVAVTAELVADLRPWMTPGAFLVSTLAPAGRHHARGPELLLARQARAVELQGRDTAAAAATPRAAGALGAPVTCGLWRL